MVQHIMLDLETWGTTPGSDIRSIGACVFDPQSDLVGAQYRFDPDEHYLPQPFYIACDNPYGKGYPPPPTGLRKYPLIRDRATVQWWNAQSPEAQAAFADPVDLKDALEAFGRWLYHDVVGTDQYEEYGLTGITLWSHGAAFDPPILAAAYSAVGLPVPWHYRAPRDTRTLFDAAGIDDHSAWLAKHPGPLGLSHHALDDAICQARAVCAAFQRIATFKSVDKQP